MNDELTYIRIFDAPRELVFRCILEPEHRTHFWGSAGAHGPEGAAGFLSFLDCFAACLGTR